MPSLPALSTSSALRLNCADAAGPWCLNNTASASPPSALQTRIVPSCPALTTRFPDGSNSAEATEPSCPLRITVGPPSRLQMRTVPSAPAVTTRRPSVL